MLFVVPGARCNKEIDSDYGLYTFLLALFVERNRSIKIAVVS